MIKLIKTTSPAWLLYYGYMVFLALLVLVSTPVVWMASDRTAPQIRLRGVLVVDCPADNNADFGSCRVPEVVRTDDVVRVKYWTTKRVRPDCPGTVQQEIVDSKNTIFSKLGRAIGPAKWMVNPENPDEEIFFGQQVTIPEGVSPGPAMFRTVTFRYCNSLQDILHWPIVQIGPDIRVEIAK